MSSIQDCTNTKIKCTPIPTRIICLVPSLTEVLYALDLADQVIAVTRYCIHPPSWLNQKTIIGGTKDPKIDLITQLNTDLIIANDEENRKEDVLVLRQKRYRVYVSHIDCFDDLIICIKDIGQLSQRVDQAELLIQQLQKNYQLIHHALHTPTLPAVRVLYLIWRKPYMAVAQNTWIHHILSHLGVVNVCQDLERYPIIKPEQLPQLKADYILLSSEPYPFKDIHVDEIKLSDQHAQVIHVDGEIFSWYGSRLLKIVPEIERIKNIFKSNI
jgi:ABC-type Fe3+-hydroxamate transport system substrate-binding protein